jgi:hypothetical protein
MRPSRLLLADDHKIRLEGFRHLLEPEFGLVAEVENGWEDENEKSCNYRFVGAG